MDAAPLAALGHWESFYVILGSSAAALTGLQFVVMALVADARHRRASFDTIDAFGTPTVVHFSAVLLASAVMSAPWRSIGNVSATVAVGGLAGVAYGLIVVRRARRQTSYQPVLEDWIWHALLPLVAYGAITAAGFALRRDADAALFAIGAAAVLLLFIGIHNAWDTVTYVAIGESESDSAEAHDRTPPRVDADRG
jgi:hypothetical protein